MKILHTADWHINTRHKRWASLDDSLDRMCREARDARVDLVVVAGDVMEKGPSAADWRVLTGHLTRFADVAPTLVVSGNHDDWPWLDQVMGYETSHMMHVSTEPETIVLQDGQFKPGIPGESDLVIHTMPWPGKATVREWYRRQTGHAVPEEEADRIAREFLLQIFQGFFAERKQAGNRAPSILVGHLEVSGAKMDNGQPSAAAGLTVGIEDLNAAECPLNLLGHIHAQQDLNVARTYYAGSPCRLSWGEAGAETKGCLLHEFVNGGTDWGTKRMDISSPRLWTMEAIYEERDG